MSLRLALDSILRGRSHFSLQHEAGSLAVIEPADFGAQAGRLVLWPMSNERRCVRRLFEALVAGVVPVIMPRGMPPKRLAQIRADHPRFGFFDGNSIVPPAAPAVADERLFLVLLTTGSTGTPKLVGAEEGALMAGITAIHHAQNLSSVASTGVLLPFAYSFALVNQLLWAVLFERQVVVLPGLLNPAATIDSLRRRQVAMICLVAYQIQMLAALGFDAKHGVDTIEVVNFAGAPFPTASYNRIRDLFPSARIYNNYGCAEALPRLTVCPVLGPNHPATLVGEPIDTVTLRIGGEDPIGPVEFQGTSVSLGFVRPDGGIEPHATWIPSGDLGRVVDGRLHVLGRHDQIVKVGGERFSLIEIEQALLAAGFTNAMAWQDTGASERGIVAIVSGGRPLADGELVRHLRNRLPQAIWPRRIYRRDDWPVLPNGKTDRTGLKSMAVAEQLPRIFPTTQ